MVQLNEVTIEREVMRCPACNAEVKATLVFKVSTAELAREKDSPEPSFHEVILKHKLKSVRISHDCSRPSSNIREGVANPGTRMMGTREEDLGVGDRIDLGTPIGRPIKDNPQA